MGKTFRRNDGRRPKWDKRGNKSHKLREIEEDKSKPRPNHQLSPPEYDIDPGELMDPL